MRDFLILSELQVPRLIWLRLRGRKVGIICIRPLLPMLQGCLDALVRFLGASGRVVDLQRARHDLVACGNFNDFIRMRDSFAAIEPWIDEAFEFANAERSFGAYAYAYKHLVVNAANILPFLAETLELITARATGREVRLWGVGDDLMGVLENRMDGGVSMPVKASRDFRGVVNGLMFLGVLAAGTGRILRRTRLSARPAKRIFIGVDYVGDPRQRILWDELEDGPGGILVVLRHPRQAEKNPQMLAGRQVCCVRDGRVPLAALPGMLGVLWSDTFTLWRRGRWLHPRYFWDLVKLPVWRVTYRALFNRFRFDHFFARDDYNTEHIIRTQELHRIGARHFGVLHGLPAYPPLLAQRRYMSFDTYYVFGEDWHLRYYLDRWPREMRVRSVGSFGMSRDQLVRLKETRPNNIVCFIKHSFQDDATFAALPRIARAFPDRTVFVKVKQQRGGAFREKLDRMFASAPENLRESHENSYELMFQATYSLSDPSSLIIEALQFGLISFAIIFDQRWGNLYFRRFPGLCVETAEEVIERIREIESGKRGFDRAPYRDLIHLGGRVIWDEIRKDMGLIPKMDAPLEHLRFVEN